MWIPVWQAISHSVLRAWNMNSVDSETKFQKFSKYNIFNTSAFRAKVVCTSQQVLHKAMEHIRKAIQTCNFPPWALNNLQNKFNHKHNIHNGQTTASNQSTNKNESNNKGTSIVVPYIHGLGKTFKRTCNNLRIQMHFKGSNTTKTPLMASKDRDNKL